jgi:hypothetical protein
MSKSSFLKEAIYSKCFSGTELEILAEKHHINITTAMNILSSNNFEREIMEERYYIKERKHNGLR